MMQIKPQILLNKITKSHQEILGDNLIGIYLHGSIAMGCFNPQKSDIDYIVVVKNNLNLSTKKQIIKSILKLSNKAPNKGIEMSIVRLDVLDNFQYPTPFELHYGKEYDEEYKKESDHIYKNGKDPDLAAHFTSIIQRGKCIFGKPINIVFKPIPEKYFIKSLVYDINDYKNGISENPIYYILNLCRTLQYLTSKTFSSKLEGGERGLKNLPQIYHQTIKKALHSYKTSDNDSFSKKELNNFLGFIVKQIKNEVDNKGQIK